ncbi:MAG TPA: peptide ABC transporter substrate-binding protein [Gemmatimonadales bacterium]|nr:peptide ABC transporter substrate-binding protein [Gemmatimonadales bacterium]
MSQARRMAVALLLVLALGGCRGEPHRPKSSIVIASVGEPSALLPPAAYETVARDIGDLVFERLATLAPASAPIDASAYRPALATRWERVDSLGWRFHLRPGARWHDGRPVTAADVVFSFGAYADSTVAAGAAPYIAGRVTAVAEDDSTVLVRFASPSPEQLYDATYHVRIIPRHIWDSLPGETWAGDTTLSRLVGSGPYRLGEWRRGESLTLVADTLRADSLAPSIGRVVWRFTADPEAALNLVLSGEADLLESIGAPDRIARVAADSSLRVIRYPAAVYGFAGFRIDAHPILADRAVRRALAMAVDRRAIAANLYGADVQVPNGPMSALLWVGYDSLISLPFSAASSAAALDAAGWPAGPDGVRRKRNRRLELEILVPSTSPARRQAAIAMQEMWRRIGVSAEVVAVEFPVFQERLAAGRFDVYIGAYLDEPSARGLADQWSSAGIGLLNHGGYRRPAFDSLLADAGRAANAEAARLLYRQALDTLNADAPAIFLYTPVQAAAVSGELEGVQIDPYSWLSDLPEWRRR